MNTLLQPDVCIPEDYRRVHRRKVSLQPETALMLAVLEEAINTFEKFAFSNSLRGKTFFHEADRWIRAEDGQWPFSFNNICDLLELDPAWIRAGLARWKAEAEATSAEIKPVKVRRFAGNRFALLRLRRSSPRMRVTTLTIGPKRQVNARPSGKLTGYAHGVHGRGVSSHDKPHRRYGRALPSQTKVF